MNILHLAASIGPRSGGFGPTVLGLVREQRKQGGEAAIWCLDPRPEALAAVQKNGLDESLLKTYSILGPRQLGFSPDLMRAAVSSCRSGPTVLHQHGIWLTCSLATNRWRSASRGPTVVAPAGSLEAYALRRSAWKKKLALWAYERKNLEAATCLHAASTAEAISFRRFGLANPIAVIPCAIPGEWSIETGDPDRFRAQFSIPSDQRLLLFLSRVHPKKGLLLLFEALALLRPQLTGWRLIIAGPDEVGHRSKLEHLAARLGIGNLIQFVGPLSGATKRNAFAATDLFVLPTYSENFGIAVAEALGAGVPVLTTRGAPWEELLTRHCGWWTDINVPSLRQALLEALQQPPGALAQMGQRGKALVLEKYTWERSAQAFLRLYQWLLNADTCPDCVVFE